MGGNAGGLPSMGGSRPSLGGSGNLPNISRPTTLPGTGIGQNRPSFPGGSERGDGITLETESQGSIGGTVESKGPNSWRFVISGTPASDPGLSVARVQ